MKPLPKTYESGKLTALYHALQVPEETIEQIKQYFQAMVNFYRIMPLKKVYEIISEQNPDWISKETFFAVTDVIRHSQQDYVILKLDELLMMWPNQSLYWKTACCCINVCWWIWTTAMIL